MPAYRGARTGTPRHLTLRLVYLVENHMNPKFGTGVDARVEEPKAHGGSVEVRPIKEP